MLGPAAAEQLEVSLLLEAIHACYGYDFRSYARDSMVRRVAAAAAKVGARSLGELQHRLLHEPATFAAVLDVLTVRVTEMFRDPSFWRIMREEIIPAIMLNHKQFKIWHAGCSSGEEVLSMCIMLKEMGVLHDVSIIATDLDLSILDRAKTATYPAKNMELNEKNYIRFQGTASFRDYYREENGQAVFNKDLLMNVSFRRHDLVLGEVFNKFDLILCRNVMIYFNQSLQNEVLKKFHESLFKYGYLAIGSKESLIWCDYANRFIVVNNEEKIYKKIKD